MKYLLFLVSLFYSFIFYIFYSFSNWKTIFLNELKRDYTITNLSLADSIIFSTKNNVILQSFFWNLIVEIIVFILFWFFLFFYFSTLSKTQSKSENHSDIHNENHNQSENVKLDYKKGFIFFVKNFWFYFWFILFYLSTYLILSEFIEFSLFILIINLIIYIYYFLSKFSNLSKDFLKTNLFLFSVYYLINYFYIIITKNNSFWYIDFLNSILIIFIFPTLIYFDKIAWKKQNFDNIIITHFSLYIFWVFLFYSYNYIFNQNLLFWFWILSTIFWIIWFEFLPQISFLKNDKIVFKYIWIIFWYIWMILWIIYLFLHFNFFIFLILALQSYYNYTIHKKYLNLISFFLSIFSFVFLSFYLIIYFNLIDFKWFWFLVFGLSFSYFFIAFSYFFKLKTKIDHYLIHFFSYFINIVCLILFFIFNDFILFQVWIILFLESIYFFLSYNKLLNLWKVGV